MKIYHAPRSRSLRVVWAAEELGVPYETVAASFQKPDPEFLALNPAGTLPAMQDGEVAMSESVAILQYLAARHGPTPFAPSPDDARYPAYLQFLVYGEASLAAPLNAVLGTRFMGPEDQKDNFTVKIIVRSYQRRLAPILRQLERGDYMAGGDFTFADISVGYALGLADMLQICEHPEPVKAYQARLSERPAYQRAAAVQ